MSILDNFTTGPIVNALVWLYGLLGNNLGLAIIAVAIFARVFLLPLDLTRVRTQKVMASLQPELAKLKEEYGNDTQLLSRKTMELYREKNVNPLNGCLPIVIRLAIIVCIYRAINVALATTPAGIDTLSRFVNPASVQLPLRSQLLWLDLHRPDPFFLLPLLSAAATYIAIKLDSPEGTAQLSGNAGRTTQYGAAIASGLLGIILPSGVMICWLAWNSVGAAATLLLPAARVSEQSASSLSP